RLLAEHFLASGNAQAYTDGEQALAQTLAAVEQAMAEAAPAQYLDWRRLEQISADYLNTYRSLGHLMLNGEAVSTQRVIRQQVDATAANFDQQSYVALQGSVAGVEGQFQALSG